MPNYNSLSDQLSEVQRLQANGLAVMQSFLSAVSSTSETVTATIENADGTKSSVSIPSNIFLSNEVNRLNRTLSSLISFDRDAIVQLDASLPYQKIILSSLDDKPSTLLSSAKSTSVGLSVNPLIKKLTSPLVTMPITIETRAYCKSVEVTKLLVSEFYGITEQDTYISALSKIGSNPYTSVVDIVDVDVHRSRYYGSFDVLSIDRTAGLKLTLLSLDYNDLRSAVANSRQLAIGDYLVTDTGDGLYRILTIGDDVVKTVTVEHVSGLTSLTSGAGKLAYYDNSLTTKTIQVPIVSNEKSIVFISIVNETARRVSDYSKAILIDTSTLKVNVNGLEYGFDAYFDANVLSIGQYLESIVTANVVTRDLALAIAKPTLKQSYFTVTQINRHLSDTANNDRILALNNSKNSLTSRIGGLNDAINVVQSRINASQYVSSTERTNDQTKLNTLTTDKQKLSSELATVIRDIATYGAVSSASKSAPKYRIRGFWPVDEPVSDDGLIQRIVRYQIRYRYVPPASSAIASTIIENENSVGVYSAWNEELTTALVKELNSLTGRYEWSINDIANGTVNNINQIDIPISYGESVLFQVRAISEAGWPDNPATSDWSDTIRIDFPTELAQEEQVSAIVSQNQNEQIKLALDNKLVEKGLDVHVSGQYVENGIRYDHTAFNIASGFKTVERATISLFDYLSSLTNDIAALRTAIEKRTNLLTVELLAPNGSIYPIYNNSKLSIFGGYYSQEVDLSNASNYGSIVSKTFYLKLSNLNASVSELLSISSGDLTSQTNNAAYSKSYVYDTANDLLVAQKNGQILYLRNRDLANSIDLLVDDGTSIETVVPSIEQATSTPLNQRNYVMYDGTSITKVDLLSTASRDAYVIMHVNHPAYQAYLANASAEAALIATFQRLTNMHTLLKASNVQKSVTTEQIKAFETNDQYLVGKASTGARCSASVNGYSSIQVPTADRTSSVTIQQGDANALLIPIVFQYRMTDYDGKPNGDPSLSLTASQFTYEKTLGLDLLNGDSVFQFDLTFIARFRATTTSSNL